jgi:uncharacterized protein (DUF58 family)
VANETQTDTKPLLDAEFVRRLERLAIAAKRVQLGRAKGERKSKRKGSSVEFADYRDYVQGDDLRHIDWNIYGRLDALYLKLFQEQEDLTVHLLIDASQSMAYGKPSKIEFAAKLAAAIGYVGLTGYDRVSVEAFSGSERQMLRPIRGKGNANRLFSFLSGLAPGGETVLEESCKSYVLRNRTKGVAVILSDFFDPEGFEGGLKRLRQSGCDVYAVHILARQEIDPEVAGDLKLLDSETKVFTEISVSPALLKRYRQNVDGFCDAIRRHCLARDIGYMFAASDTPLDRLLLEVFRRGGMIR